MIESLRCATGYIEIVERGRQGAKGEDGVINGGLTGEFLVKNSDTDGDLTWEPMTRDQTTEGQLPVKEGENFVDSDIIINDNGDVQTTRKIISEVGFETTGSTIQLGEGLRVGSCGPQLVVQSTFTGTRYEVPYQSIDKTGSGDLVIAKSGAEQNLVVQPVFDTALNSPVSVPLLATNNEIITTVHFKTSGDINNLRFRLISNSTGETVLSYPDKYRYERGEGANIVGAGDKVIDLFFDGKTTPIRILQGEVFTLEIDWDLSTGSILGTSIDNNPYLAIDYQIFEFKNIALIEDLEAPSGNRGFFIDEAALIAAIPVGNEGDSAVVLTPSNNIFFWDTVTVAWVDSGVPAGGDMFEALYDPQGKAVDVYSMANMDETALYKVFTNSERLKLQGIEAGADVNRTPLELKTDYESNADTNAFTDTEKSKLAGIETGAQVNRTNAQLKSDYESNLDTNAFTDSYKSQVDNNTLKTSFPGWDSNPDYNITKEPTGFPLNDVTSEIALEEASLSFNNGNRTFSIDPTGVDFSFYEKGIKYTFTTAQSVIIDDIEGLHFIYFDLGILKSTTVLDLNILYSKPFVAVCYWNVLDQELIYLGEERHGLKMDGHTHVRLHQKDGTIYVDGLGLIAFNIGDGSADIDAQFAMEAGAVKDEDILLTRDAVASNVGVPVFYKEASAGEWKREFNPSFNFLTTGTGRLAWNEFTGSTWQKAEVPDGHYALIHIFASNDVNYPFISVMGQNSYASITEARDGSLTEISDLVTDGLPFIEFVTVGSIILQTDDNYTNAVKSRVIPVSAGVNYVDWRNYNISPANVPALPNHNNLPGLQGGTDNERYHLTAEQLSSILFGTEYQIVESNASSATTSVNFVNKVNLTTPVIPAGTYRINWTAGISNESARNTEVRCILDNTDVIGIVNQDPIETNNYNLVGNFTTRLLTEGIHELDIEFRAPEGAGTALINQARIEIHRIS